jgi:hypothetical protein
MYVPVKLGFIILSIIAVLRIPEEFYLFKDKDKEAQALVSFKKYGGRGIYFFNETSACAKKTPRSTGQLILTVECIHLVY